MGRSEYGLEVLKDITPEKLLEGQEMIARKIISIHLKENAPDKLFVEVLMTGNENSAKAVISHEHARFSFLSFNDAVLLDLGETKTLDRETEELQLSFDKVCEFACTTPVYQYELSFSQHLMYKLSPSLFYDGYGLAWSLLGDFYAFSFGLIFLFFLYKYIWGRIIYFVSAAIS